MEILYCFKHLVLKKYQYSDTFDNPTLNNVLKQQSKTYRQTKNLLICRSSLLDGGHLYAVGDLAEG